MTLLNFFACSYVNEHICVWVPTDVCELCQNLRLMSGVFLNYPILVTQGLSAEPKGSPVWPISLTSLLWEILSPPFGIELQAGHQPPSVRALTGESSRFQRAVPSSITSASFLMDFFLLYLIYIADYMKNGWYYLIGSKFSYTHAHDICIVLCGNCNTFFWTPNHFHVWQLANGKPELHSGLYTA